MAKKTIVSWIVMVITDNPPCAPWRVGVRHCGGSPTEVPRPLTATVTDVAKTASHRTPNITVTTRELLYIARTRKKNRKAADDTVIG
jgi:hypothetical protein